QPRGAPLTRRIRQQRVRGTPPAKPGRLCEARSLYSPVGSWGGSRSCETVANTWLSEDVLRVERIRFDFPPNVGNVNPQILLRVSELATGPHCTEQLTMRQSLSRACHQHSHQFPLGGGEMNQLSALLQGSR